MEKNVTINFVDGKKINLVIFEDVAPKSAQNFIQLCKDGFYEGLCFHRVIPNFMIQGGGFTCDNGELKQKTSQPIEGEFALNKFDNPLKHTSGVISMARTSDKNSASCQFFICVNDCSYLDGQYAAFGKTADKESLDNAIAISKVKTGRFMHYDDVPVAPVVIKNVVVHD